MTSFLESRARHWGFRYDTSTDTEPSANYRNQRLEKSGPETRPDPSLGVVAKCRGTCLVNGKHTHTPQCRTHTGGRRTEVALRGRAAHSQTDDPSIWEEDSLRGSHRHYLTSRLTNRHHSLRPVTVIPLRITLVNIYVSTRWQRRRSEIGTSSPDGMTR